MLNLNNNNNNYTTFYKLNTLRYLCIYILVVMKNDTYSFDNYCVVNFVRNILEINVIKNILL